ncbi:MAG: hypothetical protein LC130_27320 [Bryobacterales bacterium]|nr:hypothetical protein [Bryobacterales bacterium]
MSNGLPVMKAPQSGFAGFICSDGGHAQVGLSVVWPRCVGGVDIDAAAATRHLYRLAGVLAMVLDCVGPGAVPGLAWS